MQNKELENSLEIFFNNYYGNINEKEIKDIIKFSLGLMGDRFTRFIEKKKRVDNIFDLLEIKYIIIKNIIYILSGNYEVNVYDGDIILNGDKCLYLKDKYFKILRDEQIINIPIPDIKFDDNYDLFLIKEHMNNVYIKIECFTDDIINKLKFKDFKNKTLIIDLRNNMGGKVILANKFLELFVSSEEPIYYIKNAKNEIYSVYLREKKCKYNRIILLVNRYTASSAELVSIVLKEFRNAIIVGENTKGKGVMQKKISLSENLEMLLPFFEFYTLNIKVNNIGIQPDLCIKDEIINKWVEKL